MNKCIYWKGCRYFSLVIADALISTFIFFPLTVLHWEGTWAIQDEYFIPSSNEASTLLSFAIGAIICTIQLLMQPQLSEWLLKQPPILYFISTRIHLYIHGWAILCYWRGVWNLLDFFFNNEHPLFKYIVLGVYLFCQIFMILFRTVRTTIGPPVSIKLDFSDDLLEADLIFKVHHRNPLWFTLDCLFTQFVVVTLSLTIWWALWWYYDEVLFSDASQDSLCLFIGFIISIGFLILEAPLSCISQKLDKHFWFKVAYEDVIFIILTWANLMYWRGFWNLWVKDFKEYKWVGIWLPHVIGTLGLFLLQSLNSTGQHGIDRDGSYEAGSGIFPNKFLTIVFQKDTKKDIQYERLQNTENSLQELSEVTEKLLIKDSSSENSKEKTVLNENSFSGFVSFEKNASNYSLSNNFDDMPVNNIENNVLPLGNHVGIDDEIQS